MHEFILYGQIPYRRHHQTLNALAEVTGARSTSYHEQHFIYEPSPAVWQETKLGASNKKTQQSSTKQQRYLQDVHRLVGLSSSQAKIDATWKVLTCEEPEPGSPNMISRSYTMSDTAGASQFDDQTNYRLHGHHIRSGHYFVVGNVVVRVFRVLLPSESQTASIKDAAPSVDKARLLDLSGTYLVEASIRLEDRTNTKLADQASKELLDAKKLLQGTIELNVPDRFSLDTRVK